MPQDLPTPVEALLTDNLAFVEAMYARYEADPNSVDADWRQLFENLDAEDGAAAPTPSFAPRSIFSPGPSNGAVNGSNGHAAGSNGELASIRAVKADRVGELVAAYRLRGHLYAKLDPLGLTTPPRPDFDLKSFGLEESDLDTQFTAGGLNATLREILDMLGETYSRTIGVEVAHIENRYVRHWLQYRMERTRNHIKISGDTQRMLLSKLSDAEIFERFLHTQFVGAKRFSLEGAESLIPLCELIVRFSALRNVKEIVIGMAHRGRLNVLANVMQKPAREIFKEFADEDSEQKRGGGDVKYHLGYSTDREIEGRKIHLTLTFNPSHLEFVDAVVAGRVRAKQDRDSDSERRRTMPLVIHGDAAFTGQGIVAELLNMSDTAGFTVGGTIHVVVNNQIGFTTPPEEARSTYYCTDIAKMLQIPIFHVNGEDPEAVAQVVQLAVDFRQTFGRDVIIDMWCYRKYGHNEADEPSFTQPMMYKKIAKHPTVREQYMTYLQRLGSITDEDAEAIVVERRKKLETELDESKGASSTGQSAMKGLWSRYVGGPDADTPNVHTRVDRAELERIGRRLCVVPDSFQPHSKIRRLLKTRLAMVNGERALDWGMAETLAYGTLLAEGAGIRLTGQDVGRGTFSHRHAVLRHFETGEAFLPLCNIQEKQGHFEVRNSTLSEASVLGYEFGYSLDTPDGLVIWEAQFGDFANGAQVIIDQFVTSSEDKWNRLSGLTMLLPHGFEGQGPEHSSARLDRWLALCAEDNIQVCNLTTPAQIFHALRRQVVRPYRKPLVVMSPKSLLRLPAAVSPLSALSDGDFQRVIPDPFFGFEGNDPARVRRVLICTGKLYYELDSARRKLEQPDVAIVRVEQLYPMPHKLLRQAVAPFVNAPEIVWIQEEPTNHGAWNYMLARVSRNNTLDRPLMYLARPTSASPATGSAASHRVEQAELISAALAPPLPPEQIQHGRRLNQTDAD